MPRTGGGELCGVFEPGKWGFAGNWRLVRRLTEKAADTPLVASRFSV